jgi:hypothetical protein
MISVWHVVVIKRKMNARKNVNNNLYKVVKLNMTLNYPNYYKKNYKTLIGKVLINNCKMKITYKVEIIVMWKMTFIRTYIKIIFSICEKFINLKIFIGNCFIIYPLL